ncbi:MAG: nucleotide-binding protein [Solirubrobacteraceae bacterium]|nr:nucleotide-binding protein [Solirubrobacteraceae bacterium]
MAARKKQIEIAESPAEGAGTAPAAKRASRVSQADVPRHTIDEALRVARALAEQYGKQPARPIDVAAAMGMLPTSGTFRTITGASVAYGFTEGGAQADQIALTDLGRRVVAPTEEGDDLAAKREALLRPRVVREFLEKYDSSQLPRADIGRNVLESMGVPADATERTMKLIIDGADHLGLIMEISGRRLVNVRAATPAIRADPEDLLYDEEEGDDEGLADAAAPGAPEAPAVAAPPAAAPQDRKDNRRVFISHGKDRKIVAHLKELLSYGEYEPVVSVERETTSKPVPDKVMDDMRSCGAGIIHVGTERKVRDDEGAEYEMLNQNVLIEIGAAMALYEGRFILLVEKGTSLPSNLQGLYRVEYEGQALDGDATLKLLKAFKDFKG